MSGMPGQRTLLVFCGPEEFEAIKARMLQETAHYAAENIRSMNSPQDVAGVQACDYVITEQFLVRVDAIYIGAPLLRSVREGKSFNPILDGTKDRTAALMKRSNADTQA